MKEHNKLVRDNIPEIILRNDGIAHVRRLDDDSEYITELTKKLIEEAHEVAAAPTLEELADVREVLDALIKALRHSEEEVQAAQKKKATKNGAFNDRIYLISTEN
jgi:predicted house-cleaning noncanonical NTP pyrophosphatase (MazG superfamily)